MMKIVIAGHHKMRTVTNLLIFNLSLTDLINTVFNSTFSYIFMKNRSDFQSDQSLLSTTESPCHQFRPD